MVKDSDNVLRGPNFSSPTFQKELEETSVDEYLISAAERNTNQIYMMDAVSNETLTYKQFLKASYNLAAELQNLGCNKDSIVGIVSENRLEYPIVILGTILTGATITCLNPSYTLDELKPVLSIAKSTIIFCSTNDCWKIEKAVNWKCRFIFFDQKEILDISHSLQFSQLIQSTKIYCKVKNRPDDLAFILYSSGTTGLPKGVMLTHRNIVFTLKVVQEENLIENNDSKTLCMKALFHSCTLSDLMWTIIRNQTFIVMREHDLKLYLPAIEMYKIKHLELRPTSLISLLKNPLVDEYDLSSVEYIRCVGAPLMPDTEEAVKNKFGLKYIQQVYGLTETLLTILKSPTTRKAGTCGSAVPGIQIKIVHLQTGRTLSENESGEIYIKGPNIMKGYFGNEKATSETIDQEGWLRSGDVGYYDEDGDIFIVDRVKEIIKCEGFQVAPAQLEALLLTHPFIVDSAVIGIPDEENEELPRAYVVKKNAAAVTENEIIQYIAGKVSLQKRLRGGVEFIPEIPRNVSGKILRRKLREMWTLNNQPTKPTKL